MSGFHTSARSCASILAVAALAATARANVIVVDINGGADFTEIQPAVDAADDGDTILVKSGTYAGFAVNDKTLAIVGDSTAVVQVAGGVRLRNLSPAKTIVLERLSSTGMTTSDAHSVYGLFLKSDDGHIRVEACTFTGLASAQNGSAGVRVESCADVALTRTTAVGGSGGIHIGQGTYVSGDGLSTVSNCTVTAYDCTIRGGMGTSANPNQDDANGGAGGVGARLSATSFFASGSLIQGGNGGGGGCGHFFAEVYAGFGGDGVSLASNSTAYVLDTPIQAGVTGPAGACAGSLESEDGTARVAGGGSHFVDLVGTAKHMDSPSPVRENATFNLTFTGIPGEQVALVVSNEADYFLKLPWKGVFLVTALHPMVSVPVGTIPPGGTLTVPWGAPDLGGQPSKVLHTQPVFIDPQGHRTIGNSSVLVMLSHLY